MNTPTLLSNSSYVVVGGGAAGTLTAARLLLEAGRQHQPVRVTLVDPTPIGRGVAYSTSDPRHRLNVPAYKMSALTEDGSHFHRWLADHGREVAEADFVPRRWFRDYLCDVLEKAKCWAPSAVLEQREASAVDLVPGEFGATTVELSTGESIAADAVVLALGHLGVDRRWVPAPIATSSRVIRDPWAYGALDAVPPNADVLLVGSGLTMIDLALRLAAPGRTIHAISRNGRLPQPHLPGVRPGMEAPEFSSPTPCLDELLTVMTNHAAKARNRYGDWRPAIDSIRAITQRLWGGLSETDRIEFLTKHARTWDSVRHRMSPESAASIDRCRQSGQLVTHTAELVDALDLGDSLEVVLSGGTALRVGAVVNCTGPCDRPERSEVPFVRALLDRGVVRPGPLGIGFATTSSGRVIDATGSSDASVWTLGSLRKGSLWESTAIPEIRDQAAALARCVLTNGPVPAQR
ncbi:MAG: FAD/NAD(P)-binding protein [Frankiaceae bacterium]|nr:FAD/NAD(P)-binding protein [Frankiaceae bacterium]